MQTRIGKDGLAVDIDGICLAMDSVKDPNPQELKLFCYGFRGDIKPFTFMGKNFQRFGSNEGNRMGDTCL